MAEFSFCPSFKLCKFLSFEKGQKFSVLCADQPDVFLQKLLKQTRDYLVQRGQDAMQKFERGYQEARAEATAALEGEGSVNSRNLDL